MKLLFFIGGLFFLLHISSGKDVTVDDALIISLPDNAKENAQSQHSGDYPDGILQKYHGDSFQLFMYRWPQVKTSDALKQIPEQWTENKKWASASAISEGATDTGIPYVIFNVQIVRDGGRTFDSVMTVLRSTTGKAYMFQMTGDTNAIDAIRQSIRNK